MLENILRRLAPNDLLDLPLYARLASEVPREYSPNDCLGVMDSRLDLALRSHLESHCEWQGRGPALLVNNFAAEDRAWEIQSVHAGRFQTFADLRNAICVSVALHEFAHVLSRPIDLADVDDAGHVQEIWFAANALPEPESSRLQVPPWFNHEAPFIRALCHLAVRAHVSRYDVLAREAFNHQQYNLSSLDLYVATLAEEIDEAADDSIVELLTTPPPEAFVQLWKSDLTKWHRTAKRTSANDALLAAAMSATVAGTQERFCFASRDYVDFEEETEAEPIDEPFRALLEASRPGPARFKVLAYSGGLLPPMKGQSAPTVVDLAGLQLVRRPKAQLDGVRVGHCTNVTNDGASLAVEGFLSAATAKRDEIVGGNRNGYTWNALMDVELQKVVRVPADSSATANGRNFPGPVNIARQARLFGVVFTDQDGGDEFDVMAVEIDD